MAWQTDTLERQRNRNPAGMTIVPASQPLRRRPPHAQTLYPLGVLQVSGMRRLCDLLPVNRTSYFFKKSINSSHGGGRPLDFSEAAVRDRQVTLQPSQHFRRKKVLLDDSFTATSSYTFDCITCRFFTFDLAAPTDGFQPTRASQNSLNRALKFG